MNCNNAGRKITSHRSGVSGGEALHNTCYPLEAAGESGGVYEMSSLSDVLI